MSREQRHVLWVMLCCVAIVIVLPFPPTKFALGIALATYGTRLLVDFDERFLGLYVLLLPVLQLVPLEDLGVTGLNWQTIFLLIFGVQVLRRPTRGSLTKAISFWMACFVLVVCFSALYGWLLQSGDFGSLFGKAKNWLFPFCAFALGRRLCRTRRQLWFLFACVALVSCLQSIHALRDILTTSNLLRHRPEGLLTGQANLFAGYLALYGVIFLFAGFAKQLPRLASVALIATATLLLATLMFTLSRGAWLAVAVTMVLFSVTLNRTMTVFVLVGLLGGYRWMPEEAVVRTETTLDSVRATGNDEALEDSLDDSAALRIIQWKTFPTVLSLSPLWGSGMSSYPSHLGRLTGIFRSAHAMIVEIGAEMGLIGLAGYFGLLGSVAWSCFTLARRSRRRSWNRQISLGFCAATVCLFLLDLTGTRFRANTVTTYYWLLLGCFWGSVQRSGALEKSGFTSLSPSSDSTRAAASSGSLSSAWIAGVRTQRRTAATGLNSRL